MFLDALNAIQAILRAKPPLWEYKAMICDLYKEMLYVDALSYFWVTRTCNIPAHVLCQKRQSLSGFWFAYFLFPPWMLDGAT